MHKFCLRSNFASHYILSGNSANGVMPLLPRCNVYQCWFKVRLLVPYASLKNSFFRWLSRDLLMQKQSFSAIAWHNKNLIVIISNYFPWMFFLFSSLILDPLANRHRNKTLLLPAVWHRSATITCHVKQIFCAGSCHHPQLQRENYTTNCILSAFTPNMWISIDRGAIVLYHRVSSRSF